MEMETLREAIDRLRGESYVADLWIADNGLITDGDHVWDGDQVTVHHVVRFEGTSNPDDEAMLLAVAVAAGPNGLITLPYGPDLSGPPAQTVKALALQR